MSHFRETNRTLDSYRRVNNEYSIRMAHQLNIFKKESRSLKMPYNSGLIFGFWTEPALAI